MKIQKTQMSPQVKKEKGLKQMSILMRSTNLGVPPQHNPYFCPGTGQTDIKPNNRIQTQK